MSMTRAVKRLTPVWLLALTTGLTAQTPGQQPTFQSRIELVSQDVVVRDSKGQFVPDIKQDEFQIFEDGVEQKIGTMVLFTGGRTLNIATAAPKAAPGGMILPQSRPLADASGRVFIIFIDDLHLQPNDTPQVRALLKKISATLIHQGDLFCVQSTGPSSVYVDLTYDKRRFDEAIGHVMGSGQRPQEIIQSPETSQGPTGVRYNVHRAFSTAYDLLQSLEKVTNRRKAFVYVSSGYDFNPFPNARADYQSNLYALPNKDDLTGMSTQHGQQLTADQVNPFGDGTNQFASTDLVADIAELTREANRANVSFYTIDPRGLNAGPSMADEDVRAEDWNNYVRNTTDTLQVMANQTGGYAIVNNNDFDKGLKRIDAETSDYYVLGYYSSNPDPLRRTRQVVVKVKRQGLTVTYRSSYSLKLPGK